jgi:hypothetical protein
MEIAGGVGSSSSQGSSAITVKAEQKPPTHTLKIEIPPTKTDRYEWLVWILALPKRYIQLGDLLLTALVPIRQVVYGPRWCVQPV